MAEQANLAPSVFNTLDSNESARRIAAALISYRGERVDPEALISWLCEELLAAGVPLWRVSYGVPILHPEISCHRFVWNRKKRNATEIRHRHGIQETSFCIDSPILLIHQGAAAVRCRLEGPAAQLDFPILRDLAAEEKVTDYVAMPLHYSSGMSGYISWITDRPGGFTQEDLSFLYDLLPLIGLRLELEASYHMSENLMETYLGRDAARRVLGGEIKRGEGERIHAAILCSDMRGFTALADRLPTNEVIAHINDYFNLLTTEVKRHGGEVLKFIGDGLLAVFQVAEGRSEAACSRALLAAIAARSAIAERNREHQPPIKAVLALHLGEVVYGNIGAAGRLDFTVIGAAVNEATRIENLCRTLKRPLLVSESFARNCPSLPLVSLGLHQLRGVAEPREIFTLPPDHPRD